MKVKQASVSSSQEETKKVVFPKRFLAWCGLKTLTQWSLSIISIYFIIVSGFFFPFRYDASVWSKEVLINLCLPQAIFELLDLFWEVWVTVRVQKKGDHLPYDSIVHHGATSAYYFYIYWFGEQLDHQFLGLPIAALSCQVIGFLYTTHRLKFKSRYIGLALLTVQLSWRVPLAVMSVLRAVQFLHISPLFHLFMCTLLAIMDYRWTKFSFRLHRKLSKIMT